MTLAPLLLTVALGAQTLAILHKGDSSLGFYTLEGKMLARVPVGQHPHEMVLSSDGRYLYTTDNGTMRIEQAGTGGNTISIIDLAARKKVGEISLGNFRRPHGIDLDRAHNRLLVSTELPDQLLVIDPATRAVIKTLDTKGRTSHMVVVSRDGGWAYVSNSTSANVSAIDLGTGEVKLIPTGDRPEGSVLGRDGRFVYVCNREGARVTIIDTEKNEAAGHIPAGRGPVRIGITPDGSRLVWAAMHDSTVEIADPVVRKVVARIPVPAEAPLVSLHVSPDGTLAFTSAQDSDTVFVVSLADRKVVRQFRTTKGFAPDPVMAIGR